VFTVEIQAAVKWQQMAAKWQQLVSVWQSAHEAEIQVEAI
jgi:hypothetical protein